MTAKTTHVYTDGSAINNQRRNSPTTFGGIGAFFGNEDQRNVSEPFYLFPITNQRTEIYAAIRAVEEFMADKVRRTDKSPEILVIHTDSQYLINSLDKWIKKWKVNNWKTAEGKDVLNKDLLYNLDHLRTMYADFLAIRFLHVKAHLDKHTKGVSQDEWYGNMMADKLAKNGSLIAVRAKSPGAETTFHEATKSPYKNKKTYKAKKPYKPRYKKSAKKSYKK